MIVQSHQRTPSGQRKKSDTKLESLETISPNCSFVERKRTFEISISIEPGYGVLTSLDSERTIYTTIDPQRVLSSLHDSPALLVKVLFQTLNVTF